jgi:hypothetical protein
MTVNQADGVAAHVYLVDESNPNVHTFDRQITQAKRGESFNSTWDGPGLTIAELEAYAQAGAAQEYLIHENLTVSLRLSKQQLHVGLQIHVPRRGQRRACAFVSKCLC